MPAGSATLSCEHCRLRPPLAWVSLSRVRPWIALNPVVTGCNALSYCMQCPLPAEPLLLTAQLSSTQLYHLLATTSAGRPLTGICVRS